MLNRLLLFDQLQVSPTRSRPFLMTCTIEPRLLLPSMASRFLSSISIALKRNFRLMSICMRPRCMRKLASSSTLAAPMAHSSPSLRRVSICMSSRWAGARKRVSLRAVRLTTISKTLSRSMRTRSRRRSSTGFAISMPSMRKRAPFSLRIAIPMQSIFWLRR